MTRNLLLAILILSLTTASQAQHNNPKAEKSKDTRKYHFYSGFYLAIPDISKKQGFHLKNSDDFYFIGTEYFLSLKSLDTIYKEFDKTLKSYVLTMKFDSTGEKHLFDFTKQHQGQKIGLLVENRLIFAATIASPIGNGLMTLYGKYSESELNTLKTDIEQVSREALRSSIIRRKTK